MQITEQEPNYSYPEGDEFEPEYTPNFILLRESMEFQLYFSLFIIGFGFFLSYMILLTRTIKIIKLEKKKTENDLRLKKKISIIFLILISLRLLRLLYYGSYFSQSDLFIHFFLEIIKLINITLIPFILKEQVKKNIRIPFKKTFIFFWVIIFLNCAFDVFLEIYYNWFLEVITFSTPNFLCASLLLFLFIKNPVKNFTTPTNDYNCYLIELENKLPEAVRKIYNDQPMFNLKSKTASPKRRAKFSDFKPPKENSILNIKEVSDFKIIRNEEIKITPNILINDLKDNFCHLGSVNHSENGIFNTLNESFENPSNVNNSKVTFNPKIEINFKDNYKFSVNNISSNNNGYGNNCEENKCKKEKNYSSDFDNNFNSNESGFNNNFNFNYNSNGFFSSKNANTILSNINISSKNEVCFNNTNNINNACNINSNNNNSNYNNKMSHRKQNSLFAENNNFYTNNNNNQNSDETKKAILDIAAKFFFVFTVQIKELQIKMNIKKNIKDFFDLENSLKAEFLYSNHVYVRKIQEKLPRLKFPKKLTEQNKNIDFIKNYAINFQIFLKSIVNEPCFVTDEVLKFLNLSNCENLKIYFRNYRQKYINNLRFNDDTINNQRYQSFISASFYEEKLNNQENDEEDNLNLNNFNSNFSTTTVDNYYFIKKMKKNFFDNSQIKNSESLILNNNTMTSGFNNAFSTNNFYCSNNHKFNNMNFSKTHDVNYSVVNYKIKVDEINIYSACYPNNNNTNSTSSNFNNLFNLNGNFSNNLTPPPINCNNHNNSSNLNSSNSNHASSTNVPNTNHFGNSNFRNVNSNNINNNNSNTNITMINTNVNGHNNSNHNININININTNVNFNNLPMGNTEGLNCLNYNINLNNLIQNQTQTGIISPLLNNLNSNNNNNNINYNSNNNNFQADIREGELIINITYNFISKIIKKKLSDFKRLIHEVSEVNKNNENIKLLNKLLKAEEIIVNNNLYSLCDSVIQNIFDNLNTIYKHEIFINEFFHEFFDDSFSYSRGLSINSNFYDCSKKFIHYHRLYSDGKILAIKGEVKDIIIMTVDFKSKNFYLISLSFDLSILISGFKQEECFLKYKYRELMEFICFMRSELSMPKIVWKNFKNEKARKKELKIAELDAQLKDLLGNKDFLKKEKWLEIFNLNKCYRQMKDYNRIKSSFTSYPSFITISRDSLQNMTDI